MSYLATECCQPDPTDSYATVTQSSIKIPEVDLVGNLESLRLRRCFTTTTITATRSPFVVVTAGPPRQRHCQCCYSQEYCCWSIAAAVDPDSLPGHE